MLQIETDTAIGAKGGCLDETCGGGKPQSFVIFSYRYLAAHELAQITASFLPGLLWVLKWLIRRPISLRVHL